MKTKTEDLQSNIDARNQEIYGYQMNINSYEAIVEALQSLEWTDDIKPFDGMTLQEIVEKAPKDKVELISDLVFRNKIAAALEVEKLEQRKAIHVLKALEKQLEV